MTKPGYKTTEFWLILAAALAAQLSMLLPIGTPGQKIAAALVAGLAAVGYSASRAIVKAADKVTDGDPI